MVDKLIMKMEQKGSLPGYASTIVDIECKQLYAGKLMLIIRHDPYGIPKEETHNDINI